MDAVEFAKTMRKICRSHTSCVECEFMKVQGHCGITNPEADHAGMVAVAERWAREHVERWAKAHPEEAADATKPKQDKTSGIKPEDFVNHFVAEMLTRHEEQIEKLTQNVEKPMQPVNEAEEPTAKPKRTNKDVLLAAFPYFEMSNGIEHSVFACPISFDTRHKCDKDKKCVDCKREYWLAEVEE